MLVDIIDKEDEMHTVIAARNIEAFWQTEDGTTAVMMTSGKIYVDTTPERKFDDFKRFVRDALREAAG